MKEMISDIYKVVSNDIKHTLDYMRHNLERYVLASEQGCYGVLKQFEIIYGAEQDLPPHFFAHFCRQLGLRAESPEVKVLLKLGERSQRVHVETGQSLASAKLYLVADTSDEQFETYARAAKAFSTLLVDDLREGTVYEHLQRAGRSEG
jgi:hypothetical protein